MSTVREVSKIAAAFVGLVIGAGFSSGQEILQFFVSFGRIGLVGAVVATLGFMFLAMAFTVMGHQLAATSHKELSRKLMGPYLGTVFDWVITFYLFAVVVVMLAGGGALLEQWLGLHAIWGRLFMLVFTVAIVCLNLRHVVSFIAAVTPLLALMAVVMALYVLTTARPDTAVLESAVTTFDRAAPYWWVAAFLYISFNMVAGMPFQAIVGATASSRRVAMWGGILGGVVLGACILLIATALYWRADTLAGVSVPTLLLAQEISPWFGHLMSVIIFGMVANTAVGTLYAFVARVAPADNVPRFRLVAVAATVVALIGSFVGFKELVGTVYPFYGYIGFLLIVCTLIGWFRWGRTGRVTV